MFGVYKKNEKVIKPPNCFNKENKNEGCSLAVIK